MAIQFKIGFKLDDKELSRGLSGIHNEIERAFSVRTPMSKDMAKAVEQAKVLEKTLRQASTDKGISFYSLDAELRKAGTSATHLVTSLAKGGDRFAGSLRAANFALATADRTLLSMNRKIQEAGRVMMQSFKFTAAQTILRTIGDAAKDAYRWVVDLDKAVTEIGVVTGKTADQLERVTESAVKNARELRVAAKDYAQGALIFYQQGLSDDEVARRTEITVKAAKAAGQSVSEMSSQLTAVWNTYGMAADEQMRAASVGAKMAAQTAVDFKDIAQAMQVAAAPAAQMGVSYNSLAAIIATVGDTTQQSASIIGNAFKTIFSRFQQLKTEGTDGEVTLNKVSSSLQSLGVNVLDQAGDLIDLDTVIHQVGESWDHWSSKQQLAIAQLVGGTRQYGQFLALMNNYDKYLSNLGGAEVEDGSALESQYTKALDSISEHTKMAGEAWKRAIGQLFDEDAIKNILKLVEQLGDLFGGLIKTVGGLPNILMLTAALLSSKIVPTIAKGAHVTKTFVTNLTPKQRADNINRDHDKIAVGLRKNMADGKDKSVNQADTKAALKVNEYGRQTALTLDKINSRLIKANGAYKVQLEGAKELLETNQRIYDLSTRRLGQLQKNADAAKAEIRIREAEELTALDAEQERFEHGDLATRMANTPVADTSDIDSQIAAVQASRAENAKFLGGEYDQIAKEEDAKFEQQLAELQEKRAALTAETDALAESYNKGLDRIEEARIRASQIADAESDFVDVTQKMSNATLDSGDAATQDAIKSAQDLYTTLSEIGPRANFDEDTWWNLQRDAVDALEAMTNGAEGAQSRVVAALEAMTNAAHDTTEATNRMSSDFVDATSDMESASRNLERSDPDNSENPDNSDGTPNPLPNVDEAEIATQRVEAIASSLTEITVNSIAATSAATALIDVFTIGGKTAEEKVTQLVGSLAMLVPTIMGIAKAVRELGTLMQAAGATGILGKIAGFFATGHIGLIIAGISAIIGGIGLLVHMVQKEGKELKAAAEKAEELRDETQELSNALTSQTQTIEDNMAAWKKAEELGEDTTETYNELSSSIYALGDSLEEAGIEVERIDRALAAAFKSGDFTPLETLTKEAQLLNQANLAQTSLDVAETKKNVAVNEGNLKTTANFIMDDNTMDFINKYPELFRSVAGQYQFSINLEDKSVAEIRDFAKELEKIQKDAENMDVTESVRNGINASLEGAQEFLTEIEESVEEVKVQAVGLGQAWVASQESDFPEDLKGQIGVIEALKSNLQEAYGEVLTSEELDRVLESIIRTNDALSNTYETMGAIDSISRRMANRKIASTNFVENKEELKSTRNQFEASKATGITNDQKWQSYKKSHEEDAEKLMKKISDITKVGIDEIKKMTYQEVSDLFDSVDEKMTSDLTNTINNEVENIVNAFNDMSDADREVILGANLEFVDDAEELQAVLENRYKLHLPVEITTTADLDSIISESNNLQEVLGKAVKDYSEHGTLDLDLANELIDSGYGEYLVVVGDQIKLNLEAQKDWNQSIEDEQNAIIAKINNLTDYGSEIKALAEDMSDLSATFDNVSLQGLAGELSTISQSIFELEGGTASVENVTKMLGDMTTALNDAELGGIIDLDDVSSLQEAAGLIQDINTNINEILSKGLNQLQNDDIQIHEYNQMVKAGVEAAIAATEGLAKAQQRELRLLDDKISKAEKGSKVEKQLIEERKALEKNSTALKEYNKLMKINSEMDVHLASSKSLEKNIDKIKKVLNDDFTLKVNVDDSALKDFDGAINDLASTLNDAFDMDYNFDDIAAAFDVQFNQMGDDAENARKIAESNIDNMMNGSFVAQTQIQMMTGAVIAGNQLSSEEATLAVAALLTNANSEYERSIEQLAIDTGIEVEVLRGAQASMVEATAGTNTDTIAKAGQAIQKIIEGAVDILNSFTFTITPKSTLVIDFPSLAVAAALGTKWEPTVSGDLTFETDATAEGMETGIAKLLAGISLWQGSGFGDNPGGGGTNPLGGITPNLDLYDENEDTDKEAPKDGFHDPTGHPTPPSTSGNKGSTPKEEEFRPRELDDSEPADYYERYENLIKFLDILNHELDVLNDGLDDAYGNKRMKNMIEIEGKLMSIGRAQKALIKNTKDWLATDTAALKNNPIIGKLAKFNEEGELLNPETLRRTLESASAGLIASHNAAIAQGNAVQASDEYFDNIDKTFENQQKVLDTANETLDQYLETEELLRQRISEAANNIREIIHNRLEAVKYTFEFKMNINEHDMDRLEALFDRLGDAGFRYGESLTVIAAQMQKSLEAVGIQAEAMESAFSIIHALDEDPNNGDYIKDFIDTFGQEAYDEYLASDGQIPASVVEFLEETRDNFYDTYEGMIDIGLSMLDGLMSELDRWFETYDNRLESIERVFTKLDFLQKALNLGGNYGNDPHSREAQAAINDARWQGLETKALNAIAGKADAEEALAELERDQAINDAKIQEALEEGEKTGNLDTLALEPLYAIRNSLAEDIAETKERINDFGDQIVSSWDEMLEEASAQLDQAWEHANQQATDAYSNPIFADIREMANMYQKVRDFQSHYLDDYDKKYHLDKLQERYDTDTEGLDPTKLGGLLNVQKLINKYRNDDVQLTEKQVELLNKLYELELARAQLQEEQDAKNTMRLARDASGNWDYIYSGDDTEQKQSKIAELEYEMKKLGDAVQEETEDMAIAAINQFTRFNSQLYATNSAYRRMIDANMNLIVESLNRAGDDWMINAEILKSGMGDVQTSFNTSIGAMITGENSFQSFLKATVKGLFGTEPEADGSFTYDPDSNTGLFGTWMTSQNKVFTALNSALKTAGSNVDSFVGDVHTYLDKLYGPTGEFKKTADGFKDLADQIKGEINGTEGQVGLKKTLEDLGTQIANDTPFNTWLTNMQRVFGTKAGDTTTDTIYGLFNIALGKVANLIFLLGQLNNLQVKLPEGLNPGDGELPGSEDDSDKDITTEENEPITPEVPGAGSNTAGGSGVYYKIAYGDTLSQIIERFYGGGGNDRKLWKEFVEHNPEAFSGNDASKWMLAGRELYMPSELHGSDKTVYTFGDRGEQTGAKGSISTASSSGETDPWVSEKDGSEPDISWTPQGAPVQNGDKFTESNLPGGKPIIVDQTTGKPIDYNPTNGVGEEVTAPNGGTMKMQWTLIRSDDTEKWNALKTAPGPNAEGVYGPVGVTAEGTGTYFKKFPNGWHWANGGVDNVITEEEDTLKGNILHGISGQDGSIQHGLGGILDRLTGGTSRAVSARTGGYTGEWGSDEGKLAFLHEKELVLNKADTENILQAVSTMRDLVKDRLNMQAMSIQDMMGTYSGNTTFGGTQSQNVAQDIKIEASFPGVSVAQEIEDAFNDLLTQVAQYNIKD